MEQTIGQVIMEVTMEVTMETTTEVTIAVTAVKIVERPETEPHLNLTDLGGMETTNHWRLALSLIPTYLAVTMMTIKQMADWPDTVRTSWESMREKENWDSMRGRESWENTREAHRDSIRGSLTLKPLH